MKYLKLLKLKFLLWYVNHDEIEVITEEEELWLRDCYKDKGFKSYCKVRNLEILKNIANSVQKRDFQRALELSGSRLEILKLQVRAQIKYRKNIL